MNVSALLQESPSGDLRRRQQQQQQAQQQLQQNQQQPSQPQQLQHQHQHQPSQQHHYSPLESSRDRDRERETRERDRDPHRHQIPHQPSQLQNPPLQHQISPPYSVGKQPSKLLQHSSHPPPGPGFSTEYPMHGRPGPNTLQLPPPSSLTKDLNIDKHSSRGPRPTEPTSNYQREPPFHSHHPSSSANASPPSGNVPGPPFGSENRHHPPSLRPPGSQHSPSSFMPPPSLDFPHERGGPKPSPKTSAPHPGGGSLPLYPTPVSTRAGVNHGPGYQSRPRSPPSNGPSGYSEPSQMYNSHSHHLPPLPPPPPSSSQSQSGPTSHGRSRTNIVGHGSHPSKNRSSPAMGSLQRSIDDNSIGHGSSMGPPVTQSGNQPSVTTGPHPSSSSSSPRTQNQMMAGPAAPGLHTSSSFFVGPGAQRERERDYERRERDRQREREWEREREREREIVAERHGDRIERNFRNGPNLGPGGQTHLEPSSFPGGGPTRHNNPKRSATDDERDWEREREIAADQQRKKEHETNVFFPRLLSSPIHRTGGESGPTDLSLQRYQQQPGHPSQVHSLPGNAQPPPPPPPHHHNHVGHHHHHLHHHHSRNTSLKGKGKDMGVMKGPNPGSLAVVIEGPGATPQQQQQQQTHHHSGSSYVEPQFRPSKGGTNGTVGAGKNNSSSSGPLVIVPQHAHPHPNPHSHHIHPHNHPPHPPRPITHGLLHHSQSLPVLPTTQTLHRSPSPQISHPIRLFPPPFQESIVPGVHLGVYVYPRLPFPFFDFPEKMRVKVGQDGTLVDDKKKVVAGVGDDAEKKTEVDLAVVERDVDREVRMTIIVPWGCLIDELPSMANKSGGWRGLKIWGGGVIGGTPASMAQIGPSATIGGRRVYTDDSDLVLCVLHAGFVSVGVMRKAKEQKNDMKVEMRLSREGRFVGGFGAAYAGGRETDQDKSNGNEGNSVVEEDGRRIMSGGWGNGHDGAGMEILEVEFVQGAARSVGIRNRKQRLLEYAERRNILCPSPSVLSRRRRSQHKRLTDSRVWKDDGRDEIIVFTSNKTCFAPGFKYDSEALKTVLFPNGERSDRRSRKRRKLDGVVENKGGVDEMNIDSVEKCDHRSADDESNSVIVETLKESFLISRHRPGGDNVADTDKENLGDLAKCRGRRYMISLILGDRDKEVLVNEDTALQTDLVQENAVTGLPNKSPVKIPAASTDVLPTAASPPGTSISPTEPLSSMDIDPPPASAPTAAGANVLEKIAVVDTGVLNAPEGRDHPPEDKEITRAPPMEPVNTAVSLTTTECTESKSETLSPDDIHSHPPTILTGTPLSTLPSPIPPVPVPTSTQIAAEPASKKRELVLEVLQRDIGEDNFQFCEDGVGILSDEVDSRDSTKKGWLIKVVKWRKLQP